MYCIVFYCIVFTCLSNSSANDFSTPPEVQVKDRYGNPVLDSQTVITLSSFSDSDCEISSPLELTADTNPLTTDGALSSYVSFSGVQYGQWSAALYLKATSPDLISARRVPTPDDSPRTNKGFFLFQYS